MVVAGTFNNTVTIGSNTITSYGGRDVFLAKSDAITGLEEPERSSSNQLLIYANPNAGKCNITVPEEFVNERYLELTIFDNSGRTVQKKILEMNDGTIKVELEAQAKGVYSITLGNGKRVFSGKMVIE
ncbi:MAG: T9SS type A sorting domain-containing protein [Bacteroidetes bacterium]|nr:T9SS type A sorting domain-containing protein [Bacteroidota bacterium]